ncbi:host RNA manipulator TomO [Wolbachia endosymbiont of Drosophila barbarae]|uniref:host RNA manipulator TomO n=1 Tax=Wolbachia endosymbiont of Drosophila barbarae TaxID=3377043 RepID=UPI003801023B
MFGSNFRDFVSQDTTSQGQSNSERLIKSWHGFEKPDSEDSGIEEEFEVLDSESQEISATPCSTPPEDLSLENAILANFPDGCDRSFTVELKDEDSYGIIPKNLTFAEIINILNQAIQEDNCEELDKVVQNIEDYEGRSITLDNENLKDFCSNQLNLELQNGSNHQHIYSNVLSQYKFDQEGFKYDYSVKELVLLAIAANDKLVEQYQDFLFAEGNLSLLPLLVGGQKYIEAFIEKFHGTDGVYGRLKDQTIQLVEPNKIGFFSVIALRKEQELLNAVFVEYVLRDFGQVLKTSNPDSLYGVLETASLIKNEEFITIVLGAFERYINKLTKKASTEELLKKSFVTLLETAISQEHTSVIEYLCKRYTNSADHAIYDVYEQAFADDKVITILGQQILKNIGVRGRKEIYDLILKTALDAGNIAFIEHLCEKCAKCSNDVIGYLNQKFKNNEFDEIYESILIALSNVEYTNTDVIVEVLFYTKEIHQNVSHNEQVIRPIIQNILKNATHYSIGQEDYSLVKEVCYLYTEEGAINVIFQEECKIFKSSIEKRIEDLEKENKLLQSEALREYNSRLPGVVNGLVQTACIVYDEYTKDPKDNKRQKNIDLIFSLMQIRNILQFSIDVQKYSCHERQDLWDEMCQTPGTFIKRSKEEKKKNEQEKEVQFRELYVGKNDGSKVITEVDSSKRKQAPVQPAGYVEQAGGLGSSNDDNPLDNGTNGEKNSTFKTDEQDTKPAPILEPVPSVANENSGQVNNVQSNGRQSDNQNNKDIQDVSATISDQVTPVSSDTENNKVEKSGVSLQSSGYVDNSTVLSFVDREHVIHVDAQVSWDVSCLVETISEDTDEVASNQNGVLLLEAQPMVQSYDSSEKGNTNLQSAGDSSVGVVSKNGSDQLPADNLEQNSKGVDDSSVSVQSIGMVISQSNSASTITLDDHKPLMKDIENDNDPSEEDNDSPQNIKKSTLSTIVVSTLVVAAVASIAIFVYLEMLAVGIAVGACCLVAAAIIYCCTPKSQVENSEVEKPFNTGKVPTAVHV